MDFFATKGIEYLLVIGYLLLFVPFAWLLRRMAVEPASVANSETALSRATPWLGFPEGVHLHRGHAWASPEGSDLVRVGIDDFAQRLIGKPAALSLPSPGQHLKLGQIGWQFHVNGHSVDLLSPVQGEVVEVNEEVVRTPSLVGEDPYGRGWLLKVRVGSATTALNNLLPRRLACAWLDQAREELGVLMGGELGLVLQDGGLPMPGFAAQLAGDRWPEIASKFFLTERADPTKPLVPVPKAQ